MKRDFGSFTSYFVILFSTPKSDNILLTSDKYSSLHDAHEFINWLSHCLRGVIPYQIVECTEINGTIYNNPFPRCEAKSKSHLVSHVPPTPLYMHVKKMRRVERERKGFYYSYIV